MKKSLLLFTIIFWSIYISSAQGNKSTEALITKLSAEMKTFMNAESVNKLKPLLDERLVFIHSNGMTEGKEEMIQHLKDGKWKLRGADMKESTVRVFKNNIAILVGKGTFHAVNSATGENSDMDLYFTEVWSHEKAGWVLISREAQKM